MRHVAVPVATALSIALVTGIVAQAPAPPPAPRASINAPSDPLLRGFRWRSIGPAGQGGRIDDLAVDEKNPSTYYIGFAVSGVWKTTNYGTTFEPVFDTYGVSSIGDLALAPSDSNIVYVGTGEANNRQTSSPGNGLWRSTDAGAHFTNIGLTDSQSIARIVVHPKDPNTVWVAAAGHLFGPNAERGVFMTTDGGRNWTKTLFVNADTGATDLIVNPGNPSNLWAAMYEHRRTAWGYAGGGPGSGLYQSTDGGKNWRKLTGAGLPRGTMGRIGLAISRSQPNVIYAQIEVAPDNEPRAGAAPPAALPGRGRGLAVPPDPQRSGTWRSTDKGRTWQFMSNENQRPMYFSQIRVDPNDPNVVYVGGVSAQKSIDGGKTFRSIEAHKGHVDNHAIWIDPANSRHVMYGNDGGLDVSWDAGVTWESVRLWAVGLAYHVSADLRHPYNVCTGMQDNGSWCGPSQNRSGGIHSWNWFNVGSGDGFQNQIDQTNPNVLYTESQNLGILRYDLADGQVTAIKPNPTAGGRGAAPAAIAAESAPAAPPVPGPGRSNVVNAPDPLPPDFVSQFNWNAPIRLSSHDPSTVYAGGRQLFISRDRGATWTMTQALGKIIDIGRRRILDQSYALPTCGPATGHGLSCILSKEDGYLPNEFGTLTEIAESPVGRGVIWAGTDDGNVQVSQDGGESFVEVGRNIPGVDHEYYVSGLEASWFDAGTAYVAIDGHRSDDWKPYIFKTTDFGRTWTSAAGNLPAPGNVNSVRQDPINRNLLFAATEFGFYVSMNDGSSWAAFMPALPTGRVDEVLVHPRDHDLILATHSRSVWIMDDITPLEQMAGPSEDARLFAPRDAVIWKADRRTITDVPGDKFWEAEPAPRGPAIAYVLKTPAADARITIADSSTGQTVFECVGDNQVGLQVGMNRFFWPLVANQPGAGRGFRGAGGGRGAPTGPVPCSSPTPGRGAGFGRGAGANVIHPGRYEVTVNVNGTDLSQTFNLLEDVWLGER